MQSDWKKKILKINTYPDGALRRNIPGPILTFLDGFVPNSSTDRSVNFVGIVSVEHEMAVFLPKGMRPFENQSDARQLYHCISEYERSVNLGWNSRSENKVAIPLGIKVLEDYILNGIYSIREKKYLRNQTGKIVWPKTIRHVRPYITKSNIPIYDPPISFRQKSSSDLILQIHSAIVRESDEQLGWLISRHESRIAPDLVKAKLPLSISKSIKVLRNELSRQYEDMKVFQLKLMLEYLDQKAKFGGKSDWRLGTTNFQVLWENICSNVFGDQKSIFPIPAIPAYQISGNIIPRPENAQRPDIIVSENNKLAVVDAKYYDFRKSRPAWSDMVKQFFYAKSYQIKYSDFSINNFFAVPDISDSSTEKVVVVDQQNASLNETFSPISIIYLDVNKVINLFISRKKSEEIRSMVL